MKRNVLCQMEAKLFWLQSMNRLKRRQYGCHFTDNVLKKISVYKAVGFSFSIHIETRQIYFFAGTINILWPTENDCRFTDKKFKLTFFHGQLCLHSIFI